jgi:DNA-binding IclR family transcriptional regulator
MRVLKILELLAHSEQGKTLGEISELLNIPKGSLSPIVHTLKLHKYLLYSDDTARYSLGVKCYEIGNSYITKFDAFTEIRKIVRELVNRCGETCHFATLDGKEVIYILKEESSEAIRMVSSIGTRIQAHTSAIGKALLTQYSEDELRELYDAGLRAVTSNTITDIDILYDQLNQAKKTEYTYETGESTENVTCVAMPVKSNGKVIAALSVSAPVFRTGKRELKKFEKNLKWAKKEIETIITRAKVEF